MKKISVLVKLAVVASSFLLAGGLIAYNTGALDWALPPHWKKFGPVYMSSSKSVAGVVGVSNSETPAPTEEEQP